MEAWVSLGGGSSRRVHTQWLIEFHRAKSTLTTRSMSSTSSEPIADSCLHRMTDCSPSLYHHIYQPPRHITFHITSFSIDSTKLFAYENYQLHSIVTISPTIMLQALTSKLQTRPLLPLLTAIRSPYLRRTSDTFNVKPKCMDDTLNQGRLDGLVTRRVTKSSNCECPTVCRVV